MSQTDDTRLLERLDFLINSAKSVGAEAADAVYYEATSESVAFRQGQFENAERSEAKDIGLRVLIGQQQASVSTTDMSDENLRMVADRAVSMARVSPEDPFLGLAPADQIATSWPDVDSYDPEAPTSEQLRTRAEAVEAAALDVDGISNSEGGSASYAKSTFALVTTNGFSAVHHGTHQSMSAVVLAGEGTEMERGYDYDTATHGADLPRPEVTGKRAAEDTLRRLNPRKIKSQMAPIMFEPRQARSMIGHLAGAINGFAIARGTSFLKDKLGEKLFREGVVISDDPHRKRGLSSLPFDAEGLPNKKLNLIDDGVLTQWILDLRTARQLGFESNARARRGVGAPHPGATNMTLHAGVETRQALQSSVNQGLFVTSMFGPQVNGNTGDYSCGVAGQWIENGELAYPVSEITIAGNLLDMFAQLTPANDLEYRDSSNSPTILIDQMTIAGL